MDVLSLVIVGVTVVMLVLYFNIKSNYIKAEPSLENHSIGAAFALPLVQLWCCCVPALFLILFLPEKYNILAYLDSGLATANITEADYSWLYSLQWSNVVMLIFAFVIVCFAFVGLYKRSKVDAAKLKRIVICGNIMAGIAFMGLFLSVDKLFSTFENIGGTFTWMIITLIVLVVGFYLLQTQYNKAIDTIYKYGTNDNIPLTSFSDNAVSSNSGTGSKQSSQNQSEPPHQMRKTDQLFKLKELLDGGILTQEEFDNEKKKILNS